MALDGDLVNVEFACTLYGYPLTNGHGERAREQPGQAGDQDGMAGESGSCNTHHKAEVGSQSITCTQHGCTQLVATCAAVTAFKLSEQGAGDAAPGGRLKVAKQAGVRTFVSRQTSIDCLRLSIIIMNSIIFHRGDGGEYCTCTEAPGNPYQTPNTPARGIGWRRFTRTGQVALPEVRVALLNTGKTPVEFSQVAIALNFSKHAVKIHSFLLAKIVLAIARKVAAGRFITLRALHDHHLQLCAA